MTREEENQAAMRRAAEMAERRYSTPARMRTVRLLAATVAILALAAAGAGGPSGDLLMGVGVFAVAAVAVACEIAPS